MQPACAPLPLDPGKAQSTSEGTPSCAAMSIAESYPDALTMQEPCHAGALSRRSPVKQEPCQAGALSSRSPVKQEPCQARALSRRSPVKQEPCHAGALSCRSPVTQEPCHAGALSRRSPVTQEPLQACRAHHQLPSCGAHHQLLLQSSTSRAHLHTCTRFHACKQTLARVVLHKFFPMSL